MTHELDAGIVSRTRIVRQSSSGPLNRGMETETEIMSLTRVTVRNVDQDVMDRVRLHIRTYGLSLGGIVTAALADHLNWVDYMTGKHPVEAGLDQKLPARLEQLQRGQETTR